MRISTLQTRSHPAQRLSAKQPNSSQAPKGSSAPPPGPEPDGWFDWVGDLTAATRLLSIGQLYRSKAAHLARKYEQNPPLAEVTPVKLQQPLVLVPGWKTTREAFDPLAEKLLEGGRNGGKLIFVQQGEFYHDRDCNLRVDDDELRNGDFKIFEVVFSDVRLPPPLAADQLKVNMAAVKGLTNEQRLDVSAFSMGGLATRCYLDQGGNDIDQFLILGTPHRGSEFAEWARHLLRRDVQWAISFAGLLPGDLPALDWLAPEDKNPNLQGLNQRWPAQKALVNEVLCVGGLGTLSAQSGWIPVTDGDGLVAANAVAPPGETPVLLNNQHHNHLNNNAQVFEQMKNFFDWQDDPGSAAPPSP